MRNRIFIVLMLLFFTFVSLSATNVLVWQKENPTAHITDAETGQVLFGGQAIANLLNRLEIENSIVSELESDLSNYDVVVVSLGTFCES